MSTGTVVVAAVIIAWVIGRQLAGEPLRAGRLIGSPVVLTVISVFDVATSREPGPTVAGIVLTAAGLVIAGMTGVLQGRRMRLESRHGYLWGQMPASVLWLWAAYFAGRGAVDVVGYAVHAQLATSSAVLLLGVGVNRLAPGRCRGAPGVRRRGAVRPGDRQAAGRAEGQDFGDLR